MHIVIEYWWPQLKNDDVEEFDQFCITLVGRCNTLSGGYQGARNGVEMYIPF